MIVLSVMLDLSFTLCEVFPCQYYKDLTCQPKKKKHAKISLNMWELTVTYFFSNHHINCITTMSTQ